MGRHSASYIAAREGLSSRSTSGGSARYVGRVGALALALGIGAAVAGGTGVANADGTEDKATPSAPESPPGEPTGGSLTVEPPSSGSKEPAGPAAGAPAVPKMRLGLTGTNRADVDSLPDLITGVQKRITTALQDAAAAVRGPSIPSAPAAGQDPDRTVQIRGSITPALSDTAGSDKAVSDKAPTLIRPTATVDPFVRRLNDAAAAAIKADLKPISVAPTADRVTPTAAVFSQPPTPPSIAPSARVTTTNTPAPPVFANPVLTVVRGVLSALGIAPTATSGDTPSTPMPLLVGVLQLLRREIEQIATNFEAWPAASTVTSGQTIVTPVDPSTSPDVPTAGDDVPTAYGDIGKWMLDRNGEISDWGGQPHDGKTLLEPVNVIIVDETSTTPEEAKRKLNSAMFWSGFPPQPIHSGGFQGEIDDTVYGQKPVLPLFGYSNNFFLFTNDHGRIFGPDPVETEQGYVWTGSFSTEAFTFYNFLPAHSYVSSNMARNALAMQMIMSGRATFGGVVPLENSYNTDTVTTGDHDGYAVVLILR